MWNVHCGFLLWKKAAQFWKSVFIVINIMPLIISGCGKTVWQEPKTSETEVDVGTVLENLEEETDKIKDICNDIFEKAAEEKNMSGLDTVKSIVYRFGELGYPAVDSKNQINMTQKEQVILFCEMVDEKKQAELTIVKVGYLGDFVTYDLQTKDGIVDVARTYYRYEEGIMQKEAAGNYQAENWNYTQDGYLLFSGAWYSEEMYVLTLSEAEEHVALRVQPLDETCRELNRKYLLPIRYAQNNMFLTDWSEEDFGTLNFYDVYDILYPKVKGAPIPYLADDNLGIGAIYQIPKDEFESVIMKCFKIESEILQSKTVYDSENMTYEYKPRGFEEVEYPEYPYSEVVGFTENSDGTITLNVHVVFPEEGSSNVYTHEVVVRPLGDGGVQYVSNKICSLEDNIGEAWHTPRLTEEKWKEVYGDR